MKAEGMLFVPAKAGRVQAVVVVIRYALGETVIYRDPQWRRLSEAVGLGLLHFKVSSISSTSTARVWNDARLGGGDALVRILHQLAATSGRKELADAPLLFWGHSSAGPFGATFAATHGERTLAFVRYHSGDVAPDLSIVSRIPAIFLVGGKDASFPQAAIAARKLWRSGRSQRSPWTWALEPEATHGDLADWQKVNSFVIPWVRSVLGQRLSPNSTALRVVSDDAGWLGNNETGEVAPYGASPGSKEAASWLPDETTARAWQLVVRRTQ